MIFKINFKNKNVNKICNEKIPVCVLVIVIINIVCLIVTEKFIAR